MAVLWNNADKNAAIIVSSDGLTASRSGSGAFAVVRATTSQASGDHTFSIKITQATSVGIGLIYADAALDDYMGHDTKGIGWTHDGYVSGYGTEGFSGPTFVNNDEIGLRARHSAGAIDLILNGSVVQTVSGLTIGTVFPAVSLYASGDSAIGHFAAADIPFIPSGSVAWSSSVAALTATSGVYTLTGVATTARIGRRLLATPGGYTLTGMPTTGVVTGPRRLTATSGVYTLTGTSITARVGSPRTMAALPGTYALTGTATVLRRSGVITPLPGIGTASPTQPNEVRATLGSNIIEGHITTFIAAPGDLLVIGSDCVPVASVESTTNLTLQWSWPKPSTGWRSDFLILPTGEYWIDPPVDLDWIKAITDRMLSAMPFRVDASGSLADRDRYNTQGNGFAYVSTESPPRLYARTGPGASDWSRGIILGERAENPDPLPVNRRIIAEPGSYIMTPQAATLIKVTHRRLAANSGSYSLSSPGARLRRGLRMPAATGAYTLVGSPSSGVTSTFKLVAASGSYALTGQSAGRRWNRRLSASVGTYTLTGTLVTFLGVPPLFGDDLMFFATRSAIIGATIPSLASGGPAYVLAGSYSTPDDAGPNGILYGRVSSNPGFANISFQSADGQWWKIVGGGPVHIGAFGGKGDNSTNNAAAFNAFGVWARAESAAGRAVVLHMSPGIFKFDMNSCPETLRDIRRLTIDGHGATLQNTYDRSVSGDNFGSEVAFWGAGFPRLFEDGANAKLNPVAIGATTVTLKTTSSTAMFSVGAPVMVGSFDIQGYGFPPNMDRFEFRKITAINSGTGVITLDRALNLEHRDDFPDMADERPCGVARLWGLETGGGWNGTSYATPGNFWDVKHDYRNLTVRKPPNTFVTYFVQCGQEIVWEDSVIPGVCPSMGERFEYRRCRITDQSEPDKLFKNALFDGCTIEALIPFQSSSMEHVEMRDCIAFEVQSGCVKNFVATGCIFGKYSRGVGGQPYGFARSASLSDCRIADSSEAVIPPAQTLTIDGTNVSYANGRITVNAASSDRFAWRPVPGQQLVFISNIAGFNEVGSASIAFVTKMTGDSSHIWIDTTFPYATLPSWANGTVQVLKLGVFRAFNCSGSATIRKESEATAAGQSSLAYDRTVLAGKFPQGSSFARAAVVLKRLRINIVRPATSSSTFKVSGLGVRNPSTLASIGTELKAVLDLTVPGIREYTWQGITGAQSGDTFDLDGTTKTALSPAQMFGALEYFCSFDPAGSGLADWQLPIVELVTEWDTMLYRPISSTFFAPFQGGLP